jgi:hypothetical protein
MSERLTLEIVGVWSWGIASNTAWDLRTHKSCMHDSEAKRIKKSAESM